MLIVAAIEIARGLNNDTVVTKNTETDRELKKPGECTMLAIKPTRQRGSEHLAAEVRDVASDAHRWIGAGGEPAHEGAELVGRIDGLRQEIRHLRRSALHDWLDGLRDEVERC